MQDSIELIQHTRHSSVVNKMGGSFINTLLGVSLYFILSYCTIILSCVFCQSINQITMRVLSPMREVALVKSILQTELLIYVAKCLMSFNVTKRTVNQSYSSISSWVFLAGAFLESLHHRSSWSLYCYSSPLPFASSSAAASSPYPTLPPVSICL